MQCKDYDSRIFIHVTFKLLGAGLAITPCLDGLVRVPSRYLYTAHSV